MEERNNLPQQPNTGMAGFALALGILAIILPIPVVDVICGIVGIVLANKAKQTGVQGLATGAFVVSIIGLVLASLFTITMLSTSTTSTDVFIW